MQEWWEGHPDAGPKEPDNSNPVEKPSLVLTSWDGEVPALSEVVICKFDGDEAYGEKWNGKVSSFRDFVQTTVAPIIKKSVGGSAEGGPGAVAADGPDMTVGDRPASVADAILPSVPQHEFQSSDVLPDFCCNLFVLSIWFYYPFHLSFYFALCVFTWWSKALHCEASSKPSSPAHYQGL